MQKITLKRIGAYFLDIFFITLLSIAISQISFVNPSIDEYNKYYDKYYEMVEESATDYNKLYALVESDEFIEINYKLTYYDVSGSIIYIVCMLLYYVGFAYWTKGSTLGKKVFGLKVVDENNNPASIPKLLTRTVIAYGLYANLILVILIRFIPMDTYLSLNTIFSNITNIITIIIFIFIVSRGDNRGLHDIISKTKVVEEQKNVIR